MECPHLRDNVKLVGDVLSDTITSTKDIKCSECDKKEQLWICLHCGVINCGRYLNGHAVLHSSASSHPVCMSCEEYSVYCYKCDEYVANDTKSNQIFELRQSLMKLEDDSENDLPPDIGRIPAIESASMGDIHVDTKPAQTDASPLHTQISSSNGSLSPNLKNSPRRRSPNSGSNGSENIEPDCDQNMWKTGIKAPEDAVRSLRPRSRKRSHSEDSSSTDNSSSSNSTGASCKRTNNNPNSPTANGKVDNGKSERREKKVVGLRNLGNTCFMNAVLQSLSNIQEFSCYFNSLPSLEGKNNSKRAYHSRSYKEVQEVVMAEELRKVLINLNTGGCGAKGAISPECLFLVIWKVVPRFRGYQQQDAHEFLRYMLDRLHTELLQLLPPDVGIKDNSYLSQRGRTSIVTAVFGGMLQSEVRCLSCGTESKKHDPFLDLSLDIPERLISCSSSGSRKNTSVQEDGNGSPLTPECSIMDCLQSFVEIEELADTELYFCSTCKSKQRSTKQFWIRRLPNVLCLHIKRFRWNNFFRTKIDIDISFPLTALDMSEFVLNNTPETRRSGAGCNQYDLAAIIVHHGTGAGSGHYTAFAINDGQWFHFNDSTVRPIDVKTVASCKPYILFYIRRVISLPNHSQGSNSSQQRTFDIAVEQPVEDS